MPDVQYGDLSAVLLQNSPFWGHWLRTPDLSIALMDEWENKIERLAKITITENVTSISGVPTWTLILLKRILEITGKQTIGEVWPSLELYMHGGVSFVPYIDQFKKVIGKDIHYLEMYNASEGFFGADEIPGDEGMLLFVDHGIFMEFMPVNEYGKPEPRTLGLQDVEVGRHYAPVISTNGGLWRYLLGDTVQFTSVFPFRIRVSGRLKHFINAFGEEVIVDNTDKAIAIASEKTDAAQERVVADDAGVVRGVGRPARWPAGRREAGAAAASSRPLRRSSSATVTGRPLAAGGRGRRSPRRRGRGPGGRSSGARPHLAGRHHGVAG